MTNLKIQNILVGVDGERADVVKQAATVAKAMNSRLKLVDAIADPPAYRKMAISNYEELANMARSAKRELLRKLEQRLRAQSLDAETAVLAGEMDAAIVAEAAREGHDLIVVATDEGGGLGGAGVRLLRKAPCSVMFVQPGRSRKRMRIAAAVDTEPMSEEHVELNVAILNLADSLAASLGAELHILHAWRAPGESMFTHSAFSKMKEAQLEQYVEDTRRQHAGELLKLLAACRTTLPARCIHLEKGDARVVIPGFCKKNKIDLLVMGTVGRAGLSAFVLGNTAEAVANEIDCSLLAVKLPPARAASDELGVAS